MTSKAFSVEDVYADWPMPDDEFEAEVMRSLHPRSSEMLIDAIADAGLDASHFVLDIGSRNAKYACLLAERFACRVLAVDPLTNHCTAAISTIADHQQASQVFAAQGFMEAVPSADACFDFIWSRDMLTHVPDLWGGLRECYRVLKTGGRMVIYNTFATDLLEPGEAARLYAPLAVVAANMSTAYFEEQVQRAGLHIVVRDEIGSEWREYWEESGAHHTAKQLLKIAHLRRDRDRLIAVLGEKPYAVEFADCHWGVYQMLGKLRPMLYILEKP